MVANMQAPVLCECIDTRIGVINTAGGIKPVFIMQLHNESINERLIKYFNCNSTTEHKYKVPHNSDFAKLYRSTLGANPTKRFSTAHQLLNHFAGYWFIANYERAQLKKGQQYFKVTHIEPENPARNDAWTHDGTLKKATKPPPFKTLENGDEVATSRRQSGENVAKQWRQSGDSETLQAANSFGLEPVFNPTKTLPNQGKTTNTQDHVLDAQLFINLTDTAKGFYIERLDVLLNSFGFENPEAETLAMGDVIIKYGQAAYLPILVSEQTNDEWLTEFNGVEQTIWN